MGPISVGTANDLHALATVAKLIMSDSGVKAIESVKAEFDSLQGRLDEISAREAAIVGKQLQADLALEQASLARKAAEQHMASAEATSVEAAAKLARAGEWEQRLEAAQAEFDLNVTEVSMNLVEREGIVAAKEAKIDGLMEEAKVAKAEYEEKVAKLKSIM